MSVPTCPLRNELAPLSWDRLPACCEELIGWKRWKLIPLYELEALVRGWAIKLHLQITDVGNVVIAGRFAKVANAPWSGHVAYVPRALH